MKSTKLLLALVLAISLSPCVKATIIPLGPFSGTTWLVGVDGPGAFVEDYAFPLASLSNITDSFGPLVGIPDFAYSLFQCSVPNCSTGSTLGTHTSYSGLSSGLYEFIFSGTVAPTPVPVGIYFGDFNVAAATIPELDTWLMLLIGAGLLGYQLRRRQNSIRQFAAT